jgi:hypothetical protein
MSASIRTQDNVLLIKLAIFDALAGISVIFNTTANCFYPVLNSFCLVASWMLGLSVIGSTYSLLGITVERYLKVCHPYTYMRKVSKKTIMLYCLCEMLFIALLVINSAFQDGIMTGENKLVATDVITCSISSFTGDSSSSVAMQSSVVGIPLIISTVIYIRLSWIARKQRQRIKFLNVVQAAPSSAPASKTTNT